MNQSSNNISADKFKLIYEFDKNSPLFARVAQSYLDSMEVNDAIDILTNGISIYPNYPSAYIVYAKAQAIKGNKDQAIELLKKASDIISSPSTLEYYLQEIDKLSREYANYNSTVAKDFVPDKFNDTDHEDEFLPEIENLDSNQDKEAEADLDLESLTEKISKAKMPKVAGTVDLNEESQYEYNEGKIVSETLAGIYFSQGNYEEALQIYKELIVKNPHKTEEFNIKIAEIEKILRDKTD